MGPEATSSLPDASPFTPRSHCHSLSILSHVPSVCSPQNLPRLEDTEAQRRVPWRLASRVDRVVEF